MKPLLQFAVAVGMVLFTVRPAHAAEESLSITLAPPLQLTGTTSLNFHPGGEVTLLRYETPAGIVEQPVEITREERNMIRQLAHAVLREVMEEANYAAWPLRDETVAVAVTRDDVSKSVSTRRFSETALKLKDRMEALRE